MGRGLLSVGNALGWGQGLFSPRGPLGPGVPTPPAAPPAPVLGAPAPGAGVLEAPLLEQGLGALEILGHNMVEAVPAVAAVFAGVGSVGSGVALEAHRNLVCQGFRSLVRAQNLHNDVGNILDQTDRMGLAAELLGRNMIRNNPTWGSIPQDIVRPTPPANGGLAWLRRLGENLGEVLGQWLPWAAPKGILMVTLRSIGCMVAMKALNYGIRQAIGWVCGAPFLEPQVSGLGLYLGWREVSGERGGSRRRTPCATCAGA